MRILARDVSLALQPNPASSILNSLPVQLLSLAPDRDPANLLAVANLPMYRTPDALTAMSPATVGNTGGSQAHLNMQPFLTLNFCIALQGIFPSQN